MRATIHYNSHMVKVPGEINNRNMPGAGCRLCLLDGVDASLCKAQAVRTYLVPAQELTGNSEE
jgi:hypothetical protein